MSFRVETTRAAAFKEFSETERAQYFGISRDKVIFNIDTLYFTVYLYEVEEKTSWLLDQLAIWKKDYNEGNKDIGYYDMEYLPFHFCHYEHCFRIENMFDIFIEAGEYANGRVLTQYDETIQQWFSDQAMEYAMGAKTKEEAIASFKQQVMDNLGIEAAE